MLVKLNGIFGTVTAEEIDGEIVYFVNGEKCATEAIESAAYDHDRIESNARFILAGVGHGFVIGRMSK